MGGVEPSDPTRSAELEARLAERMVSLADSLVEDYDVMELLNRLVNSCVALLGVSAAGLLLVDGNGTLKPLAFSNEDARFLEQFQVRNQEGPCLEAVRSGAVVTVRDLSRTRARWPRAAAAAVEHGFPSVLAVPMRVRGTRIGGLTLFAAVQPPLSEADQRVAQ